MLSWGRGGGDVKLGARRGRCYMGEEGEMLSMGGGGDVKCGGRRGRC